MIVVATVVLGAVAATLMAAAFAAMPLAFAVLLGVAAVLGHGLRMRAARAGSEGSDGGAGVAFGCDNDYPHETGREPPPAPAAIGAPWSPAMPKNRFETPQLLAFDLLLRTASELDQQVGQLLRPAEVTPAQYNVLRILRNAGADGLACSEVSDRLVRHDPDVTRLLDRLEVRGLVSRARDTADRRVVIARITDDGLAVLDKLGESIAALHAAQFRRLGRQDFRTLVALLEQLRGEDE